MGNNIKWKFTDNPIKQATIDKVEKYLKIKFPDDYVNCIIENHGGYPELDAFDFNEHKEAVFNHLLSFDLNTEDNIIDIVNYIKDRIPVKVIPFADDPFGNKICFDYRNAINNSPQIVYWNHEEAEDNPECAIHYICDTFTDLLNKLYLPE